MKVITIGSATYDAFILHHHPERLQLHTVQGYEHFLLLHEGEKEEIHTIVYRSGGGATNSACSFAKLGWHATPVCLTGQDYQRTRILEELNAAGLDTAHLNSTPQAPTGLSFMLTPPNGNSAVLAYRGANHLLDLQQMPLSLIPNVDVIYVTSLGPASTDLLTKVFTEAQAHVKHLAWNPGGSQLMREADRLTQLLSQVNTLVVNAREAQLLVQALCVTDTDVKMRLASPSDVYENGPIHLPLLLQQPFHYEGLTFTLPFFFKHLLGLGPRTIVVTNGEEGAYIATANGAYFHPSIPTNVVSTVGAGDAFGSCFVATLARTGSVETALRYAVLNSSSVVSCLDAKEGLLSVAQLEEQVATISPSLLRPLDL